VRPLELTMLRALDHVFLKAAAGQAEPSATVSSRPLTIELFDALFPVKSHIRPVSIIW
jgi:hypothetical protein